MPHFVFLSLLLNADPAPTIRLSADASPAIEVVGLSDARLKWCATLDADAWNKVFRVSVAGPGERPPLLGKHRVVDGRVRFVPRFPLVPGNRYRATFDPDRVAHGVLDNLRAATSELVVPKPVAGPPTSMAQVYPTASRLPENTLRFYLQFSAPMSRGRVYRYITLLDGDDKSIANPPFLELDEELWSPDGTRFTLLFNPGRVKRGLVPREEEGPALEAGKRYTLAIDAAWPDADGRPLRSGYRKTFTVGDMDEEPIDVQQWAITSPAGRGDALVVKLPKPLDRGLLARLVWVTNANGEKVDGVLTVGGGERVLSFAPATPWAAGRYQLVADTRLEDPCGNRVGEPFEVNELRPVRASSATVSRGFAVR